MTEKYLFGDSDLAGRRLKLLADVFAASTRAFMAETATSSVRLGMDLGCGPGYTTHLLAGTLESKRVVGLDNSEHFIGLAEKTATDKVSFRLHDVRVVPFPVGPCDLIYGRFLLTHLREPEVLISKWVAQLCPRGRLLVEEVEAIDTQVPAFAQYIGIVEAMLVHGGFELYVGPKLDATPIPHGGALCLNRVARVPVTNNAAAKMFSMNIQTWKHNAFVRENYSAASIRELEEALRDLAATPTEQKDIEWSLRQLVYEREK